jgi:hypothetical protein
MALGIALIELPCTAGFPVLWSNLVASHGVGALEFTLLLALYLVIYLLDELLVFGTAVLTLKASRLEEKHGRVLKLAGGMVMLALALVLLLDPDRMNTLGGSLPGFRGRNGGDAAHIADPSAHQRNLNSWQCGRMTPCCTERRGRWAEGRAPTRPRHHLTSAAPSASK